jgi:ketosteroid isomerase-like protein
MSETKETHMPTHDREEIEAAFKNYFLVGPVNEDWIGWSRLFTEDAVYFDHYYGRFRGPQEIQLFLEATMMTGKHCYTALDWYNIDGDHIVWKGWNRADHPDPAQPPFEFPSLQILTYAGDGKWSSEEDWWIQAEMVKYARGYRDACKALDPDFADKLSRRHWGDIDWARPPQGHVAKPSWLGREHEVAPVRRLEDMTFGERV